MNDTQKEIVDGVDWMAMIDMFCQKTIGVDQIPSMRLLASGPFVEIPVEGSLKSPCDLCLGSLVDRSLSLSDWRKSYYDFEESRALHRA